jgi:hypothetical protein
VRVAEAWGKQRDVQQGLREASEFQTLVVKGCEIVFWRDMLQCFDARCAPRVITDLIARNQTWQHKVTVHVHFAQRA